MTLVERLRGGDDEALDCLVNRYYGPLQRWARGRLPVWARDAMDTQDVVHDTLLRTLRNVRDFEPRRTGAFHAYLRQGINNRIRDEVRRVARRPGQMQSVGGVESPAASPLEDAVGQDLVGRYERALAALEPAQREAIIARVELGLSYAEVAAALDKPSPDAARMAVARALVQLAEGMGHEERA